MTQERKLVRPMSRRPANRGKVMLSAWVDAPLRDYVRTRAQEAKQPVSEWVERALMRAVQATSLGAFCFPPRRVYGEPGVRDPLNPCDMFTPGESTNGACSGDGHHLCGECSLHQESPA